jgi:hypothetical protein
VVVVVVVGVVGVVVVVVVVAMEVWKKLHPWSQTPRGYWLWPLGVPRPLAFTPT